MIDLIGQRFGRLLVVSINGKNKHNNVCWLVKCDCGTQKTVASGDLRNNHTKSCGCLKTEKLNIFNSTHRLSKSAEYNIWNLIKSRCYREKDSRFHDYGGRGIKVSKRWKNSFENFIMDMGPRPSNRYSIDRINNNGNYTKSNCRWATNIEQCNNTRYNIVIKYLNKNMTVTQACRIFGSDSSMVLGRIRRGWEIVSAIETPPYGKKL